MKKSRFLDFFEIKRPVKSSMKNAGSVSDIDQTSDENEIRTKERLFIRHGGTLPKSRSSKRYRKKLTSDIFDLEITNMNCEDDNDNSTSVKLLAKKFENMITTLQVRPEFRRSQSFSDTRYITNENINTKVFNFETQLKYETPEFNYEDKVCIETGKKEIRTTSECTYDSKKNDKKKRRKNIRSFSEAETDEEKETYRQILLEEMDEEYANMKLDGFIYDTENISNDKHTVIISTNVTADTKHDETFESSFVTKKEKKLKIQNNSFVEDFSESLGDDLEHGSFVVEAYNDDGRELIIVQLSVDRKAVNLNSLQSIQEVIEKSEIVFYENENSILSTVSDPEDIVNRNGTSIPEEPIYETIYEPIPTPRLRRPQSSTTTTESEYSEVFSDENSIRKRSIVYSVASTESSHCEEDEGISTSYENVYTNVRRETFCDNYGNIRIERIGYPEKNPEADELGSPMLSRNNSIASTKRLYYLLEEIKLTESKYVEDLNKIVKKYIPYIIQKTPPNLVHLQGELFGNISRIYRKQKKFLESLLSFEDVESVAMVFIENEFLFDLYPVYLKNKPKSDFILKEFQPIIRQMQEHYGERLDFSAYLLTPLQRLGKYTLLLDNIEKELKKLEMPYENTQKALGLIKSVMSRGNDCVAIESIQRSPVSKVDYGSFIMRDKFTIVKPRRLDSMVFLFSHIVVFTIEDQKCIDLFTYYDSIKMDDLRIATFEDGTIHLIDFTKSKRKHFNQQRYTFVLETKVDKIRSTWRETIEQMLWQQLARDKANSLKFPLTSVKKKPSSKRRVKSTGSAVFYTV